MSTLRKVGEFKCIVQALKAELKQTLIDSPAYEGLQPDEWLRTLHDSYTQRFLSDNSRIWMTASIMIPLSLAPFAALTTIEHLKPTTHIPILAFISIAIMISWLVMAENHRAFQEKSRAWIVAIEQTLGLEKAGTLEIQGNCLNRLGTCLTVQCIRWLLAALVVLGWGLVWAFYLCFALHSIGA